MEREEEEDRYGDARGQRGMKSRHANDEEENFFSSFPLRLFFTFLKGETLFALSSCGARHSEGQYYLNNRRGIRALPSFLLLPPPPLSLIIQYIAHALNALS